MLFSNGITCEPQCTIVKMRCALLRRCGRDEISTHHADGFHGEHGQTEERRKRVQRRERRPVRHVCHVLQQIVERDAQAAGHQQVGHHGHGRQVLEVGHVAEQHERHEQRGDEVPDLHVGHVHVVRVQLLEVGGDDDGVHAARAEVRDEQQPEHRLPGDRREPPGPRRPVGERHLGHVRVAHLRHFRPSVQRVSAFHLCNDRTYTLFYGRVIRQRTLFALASHGRRRENGTPPSATSQQRVWTIR